MCHVPPSPRLFSVCSSTTHPLFLLAANDKTLLNEIFIQCGYQELVFIRNSGATLGFLFGFIQMMIWVFWHPEVEVPLQPTIQGDQMNGFKWRVSSIFPL